MYRGAEAAPPATYGTPYGFTFGNIDPGWFMDIAEGSSPWIELISVGDVIVYRLLLDPEGII